MERVWKYINRFTAFNNYRHTVWATRKGKVYPLPFGLAAINLLLEGAYRPLKLRRGCRPKLTRKPSRIRKILRRRLFH